MLRLRKINTVGFVLLVSLFFCIASMKSAFCQEASQKQQTDEILRESGVQGGVIVHLGCGDGRSTAALRTRGSVIVHGLDRNPQQIAAGRESLRRQGLYGPVSLAVLEGKRLPYAENLINLIVAEDAEGISREEMLRVLRPGSVAYVRQDGVWKKDVKPWPDNIDEWNHFLHGPDNNAVGMDDVVGPPRHLQWVGGPRWARGHEQLASISAAVTAGGRIFYITDLGPTASVSLPSKWVLVARDAFNGVQLWQKPVPKWETQLRPFRSGPTDLPRRLVAYGDDVFVTLGYGEPLVRLDAATGKIEHTFADSAGTEEIIYEQGRLFLVLGNLEEQRAVDAAVRRGEPLPAIHRSLMAVDAQSGKILWDKIDDETADLFSQTLATKNGRVFFQNTRRVHCLDAESGSPLWQVDRPASIDRPAWSVPTLVAYDNVVISADRKPTEKNAAADDGPQKVDWEVSFDGGKSPDGKMVAYSIETGKELWSEHCREGYNSPVDVLLTDGLLWTGEVVRARDPGITQALNPLTGDVARTREDDQKYFLPGMSHHRCYRNRATKNFLFLGRSGVELVDVKTGKAVANHWIRGTCQFGVIPANGLLYVPPHTCACYLKTKLNGFNALASTKVPADPKTIAPQLQQGPAFGKVDRSQVAAAGDWPTYRHDATRSGATQTSVGTKLQRKWASPIGGKLTSLVAANGKIYVARQQTHTLFALDAETGETVWSYTTGGKIDSPPTVDRGLVLFGSVDGHLYCVRESDGELVWRFRAGTEDRLAVVEDTLESVWPLYGSPLVRGDTVYFTAGRSSYLDGGIYLYAVDVNSGKIVSQTVVSGRDAESGEQPFEAVHGFDMPSGLPDVLSSDGESIFMRDLCFNGQCEQQPQPRTHLFSPTGFLDDSWWHRSYWLFGDHFVAGWGGWWQVGNEVPAGRILVFNEDSIYGYGRNMMPQGNAGQWATGEYYRLFSAKKLPQPVEQPKVDPKAKRRGRKWTPKSTAVYHWQERISPEVRAMVLAADKLFIAGPHGQTHESLAAFQGQEGISLDAVSANDGSTLASVELQSVPVFDGLIAANGRLYLADQSGQVACYTGK